MHFIIKQLMEQRLVIFLSSVLHNSLMELLKNLVFLMELLFLVKNLQIRDIII